MSELESIQNELRFNKHHLAFFVGNGINRYAYDKAKMPQANLSWNDLLLDVWRQIQGNPSLTNISKGISLTEFYNIMEMEAGDIDKVRMKIVDIIETWKPVQYHEWLQHTMIDWNVPLLTTNFDRNLDYTPYITLPIHKMELSSQQKFTDYYPWNVYFSNQKLTNPIQGFGVWHINGMVGYRRSIRLSLSEYTRLASRTQKYLHGDDRLYDFDEKNKNYWQGLHTWLHIIFNCSLCVFGLTLDENETFLRWLLIERARYFRKFPERNRQGWYVCKKDETIPEGKKMYLDYVGLRLVQLDSYEDIYERMLGL